MEVGPLVPTLCVGTHVRTLCVLHLHSAPSLHGQRMDGTQSVRTCVPTQSVGTRGPTSTGTPASRDCPFSAAPHHVILRVGCSVHVAPVGQGSAMSRFPWLNKKVVGAVAVLLLLLVGGVAWLERTPLLLWYYVRNLTKADDNNRTAWIERVAGLGEEAVPPLLICLKDADPNVCRNAHAALTRLSQQWGVGDSRTVALAMRCGREFAQFRRQASKTSSISRPSGSTAPPRTLRQHQVCSPPACATSRKRQPPKMPPRKNERWSCATFCSHNRRGRKRSAPAAIWCGTAWRQKM